MSKQLVLASLWAFAASLVLSRLMCSRALGYIALDRPGQRSLHTTPTPRTGGIAIMTAVGLTWALAAGPGMPPGAALFVLLCLVFVVEDLRGVSIKLRLVAQFVAAAGFVLAAGPFPGLVTPLFLVGIIVWSANLYNFMDGAHGYAGGMTAIGFGALGVVAASQGATEVALLSGIVASAAAGFLVWNFDPARIFLGDTGSVPLGFLAAAIGLHGWQRGLWGPWFPLLVFSPFILDATLTLGSRAARGERIASAHNEHYYQRLVRMGWSHRRLALCGYLLMGSAAATAVTLSDATATVVADALVTWLGIYLGLALLIERQWRAFAHRSVINARTAAP